MDADLNLGRKIPLKFLERSSYNIAKVYNKKGEKDTDSFKDEKNAFIVIMEFRNTRKCLFVTSLSTSIDHTCINN